MTGWSRGGGRHKMGAEFSVRNVVGEPRQWQGNRGPMVTYDLVLDGPGAPQQTVELHQVPKTPPPQPGDPLFGTIVDGKKGPQFKKEQRNGSQPRSSGSGDQFERRPEHPLNAARMARSKALELAPAFYEQLRTEGVYTQAEDEKSYFAEIARISRWVEGLINQAKPENTQQAEEPLPFS